MQAVEMSYLRSACVVSRMDGMSNESVYEHFGTCHVGEGKKCGVVEAVKRQVLKWVGHMKQMEEVNDFKYLGSVMCKHGGTEGETRERALQGRKVVGSQGHIINGRSVSLEVKRDLRNTVIVPTLTYASKTWVWNESQRSRVQTVEMSYLRSACGVSRMGGIQGDIRMYRKKIK